MPDPKLLYSANSELSFHIAERYYSNKHYIWCSPYLGQDDLRTDLANQTNPPSSVPLLIYKNYADACRTNDKHSAQIAQNRAGLIKGAGVNLGAGIINHVQHDEIVAMATIADVVDFRPILYIVPFSKAKALAMPISCRSTASVQSVEYVFEKLPRHLFDAVRL